jgi:hypothetical protein
MDRIGIRAVPEADVAGRDVGASGTMVVGIGDVDGG